VTKHTNKPSSAMLHTALGGLIGLIVSAAAPVMAATGAGPLNDEMIVTARKKEELLIETPIAISAFNADTINNLGFDRIDDIARHTPGFSFNTGLGRQPTSDRPMIRGLTTVRNGIANASSATVFIDGVYVGGSSQSTELYNLERVEVLRGPQAALYGRNTYAGVINYVTRGPTDEFAGEVRMTGAEHDTAGLTGWVSGPLIENRLGFVIAAGYRQYGGEYRNTRDGNLIGGEESSDITTKLRWTPTDSLDITLKAGLHKTDDEHFAASLQERELNNCCFRSAEAPRAREYYIGDARKNGDINLYTDLLDAAGGAGTELDRQLASLNIDWDLNNGYTLTSLTGYVEDEIQRGIDGSYDAYDVFPTVIPIPGGEIDMRGSFTKVDWLEQTDFSQELRLRSPDDRAVRWTTGVYYYNGDASTVASNEVFIDDTDQIVIRPPATPLADEEIDNFAVFGGIDWDFLESWTATAELRWSTDRISVDSEAFTKRSKSLTPRFTLGYTPNDDLHYYLNVAKGVKPGDFNSGFLPDEVFREIDEESVWNYEIGAKGRWWQQRIAANVALFYLDVDDQQLTTIIELPAGGTKSIIQNVGSTSVFGIETEFGVTLTENLRMDLGYAWTRAEYRDHISTDEADLQGWNGDPDTIQNFGDVSGNLLPRVPEHMGSVVMRYELPFAGDKRWYVSGDYTFESSRYAQEHNLIETGDRSTVGLRTGFDIGLWEATLWVTNLLDDDTPVDIQRFLDRQTGSLTRCTALGESRANCSGSSTSPRGFVVTLPRGRQYGATISLRF
jgi:iron complex outermembrane receptor protein